MNTFLIADCHFGHTSPYTVFKQSDGCTLLRPHGSAEAGDQAIEDNWNKVVKAEDKVYVLGDITMGTKRKSFEIFYRLNGKKVLIKGNHDLAKLDVYQEHFYDIRGSHGLAGMLLTHIPVHTQSLGRWGFNVHGHLHGNSIMLSTNSSPQPKPDPRYLCVSVEQINYTPISLEDVLAIKAQRTKNFPKLFPELKPRH